MAANTFTLRYRTDANLTRLGRRLEAWEQKQGNLQFRAHNLTRLPKPIAFELVHVYVALRERYPTVRPDYIDFCSTNPDGILAWAFSYHNSYPTLRKLAIGIDVEEDMAVAEILEQVRVEFSDPSLLRRVRHEISSARDGRTRDLTATGAIEIGQIFRTKKSYRGLLRVWQTYNERADRLCRPHLSPEFLLSPAASTMVHEFGHLVEAELLELGYEALERTYRDLSEILLGKRPSSDRQWRYHLGNFPAYPHTGIRGPQEGSLQRRRQTRKALRHLIGHQIGTYAPTSRDEIFAESFAVAHGSRSPHLRAKLQPFLQRLQHEGLARTRRPSRTW
jgi:hypothetical protein